MPKSATDTNHAPARQQASGFEAVRRSHQTEMAEDYVELIAALITQHGEARPVDIAACLGVSPPTVSKNLTRLKRDKLVLHAPYRAVFLTDTGQDLAAACAKRHRIVVQFLIAIGIDPDTAEQDAEGIEHHVSEATLTAFTKYIEGNS